MAHGKGWRNNEIRQKRRPPDCRCGEESFVKCEEWEEMTKLQSVGRWVFGFEEVPLVIVAWLVTEFVKVRNPALSTAVSTNPFWTRISVYWPLT